MKIYYNGKFSARPLIPIADAFGGEFGPHLVENILVRKGKMIYWGDHFRRYELGRKVLGLIALPWDLKTVCLDTIKTNHLIDGNLSIRAWSFKSEQLSDLMVRPLPKKSGLKPPPSISLLTLPTQHFGAASLQPRLKTSDMLSNLNAFREKALWADDGLRLSPQGYLTEGIWTNILMRKGNTIFTPPLHIGILEGVTRGRILQHFLKKGFKISESNLTRYDLYTADQVWVCSSLWGAAISVHSVDGRDISLK